MTGLATALLVAAVALLPVAVLVLRGQFSQTGAMRVAMVGGLVVLVAGWSWWQYRSGNNFEVAERIALHREDPAQAMRALADSVARRVEAKGEQASMDDLVLLARTRETAGELGKAAEAYALANRKADYANADLLVAEASARLNDADAGAASRRTARQRIEQALASAPEHPGANYYAGALALHDGQPQRALPHLEIVLRSGVLGADTQRMLESRVAELRGLFLEDADSEAVGPDTSRTVLRVHVTAGAGWRPAKDGVLFVAARAPGGPPMPLAAARIDAPRFPMTVELSDAHRLADGPPLDSYEVLELSARFEASGAITQGQDVPTARGRMRPAENREIELQLP